MQVTHSFILIASCFCVFIAIADNHSPNDYERNHLLKTPTISQSMSESRSPVYTQTKPPPNESPVSDGLYYRLTRFGTTDNLSMAILIVFMIMVAVFLIVLGYCARRRTINITKYFRLDTLEVESASVVKSSDDDTTV